MLNETGEKGHTSLVPDFREKSFNCSPLDMILALSLTYIAFIMLRNFPSTPSFLRAFSINGCWTLLNVVFFCTID